MPLNLGNVQHSEQDQSIEDIMLECANDEIEMLTFINRVTNLENAKQIQDMAKQFNSTECIQFAEQLLGVSMEVNLPDPKRVRGKMSALNEFAKYAKDLQKLAIKFNGQIAVFKGIIQHSDDKDLETARAKASAEQKAKFAKAASQIKANFAKYSNSMASAPIVQKIISLSDVQTQAGALKLCKYLKQFSDFIWSRMAHIPDNASKLSTLSASDAAKQIKQLRIWMSCLRTSLAILINCNRALGHKQLIRMTYPTTV